VAPYHGRRFATLSIGPDCFARPQRPRRRLDERSSRHSCARPVQRNGPRAAKRLARQGLAAPNANLLGARVPPATGPCRARDRPLGSWNMSIGLGPRPAGASDSPDVLMEVGDLDLRVGRIPRQGGRGRECELFGTGEDPQAGGAWSRACPGCTCRSRWATHSEDVRLFIAVQFRERVRFVQIGLQARTTVPPPRALVVVGDVGRTPDGTKDRHHHDPHA